MIPNYSLVDISNEFNVDRDTASKILKDNNIDVRRITNNSISRNKKIIIYNLNGEFIKVEHLGVFKDWLLSNQYTKDKLFRSVYSCLRGSIRQCYGFIVRWYIDNYPKHIEISDYWDNTGVHYYKKDLLFKDKNTSKFQKFRSKTILAYDLKTGNFLRINSLLDEINRLEANGLDKKTASTRIQGVLKGNKKSYKGIIYRWYINNYPLNIDVSKNWKEYYWEDVNKSDVNL